MAARTDKHNDETWVWDNFLWWTVLTIVVLAVPSVAFILVFSLPVAKFAGADILFMLLCWIASYMAMRLMMSHGQRIIGSAKPSAQPTMGEKPAPQPYVMPMARHHSISWPFIDRRVRKTDRRQSGEPDMGRRNDSLQSPSRNP